MSMPRFRKASLALAGILIAIGGCSESPSSPAAPKFLQRGPHPSFDRLGTSTAVIDSRGGMVQTALGDRIVFPAGAVSGPTEIKLSSDPVFVGITVEPHGLTFPAGHEPSLILNGSGANLAGAVVGYIDESGVVAEVLPASASGSGRLQTTLPHFSKYVALGG